jgi:transcriptional regulator with XRE-family HTH domain
MAGVSISTVSRLEHGELDRISLRALRNVAAKLEVVLELVPHSSGGDLERFVNARHAALGESVSAWMTQQPGWIVAPEVSFSIYGERGIIDLLVWHEASCSLVVIELKTAIVDVDELIGTLDRKRRLAATVARERGWTPRSFSAWLIVGDSRTNRRRVAEHRVLLTSSLPSDGRSLASLFRHPEQASLSGIAFWSNSPVRIGREFAARQRVRRPRPVVGANKSGAQKRRAAPNPQMASPERPQSAQSAVGTCAIPEVGNFD